MATTTAKKSRKRKTPKSAQSSTTSQGSLERELDELRDRIRELESELEVRPRSSSSRQRVSESSDVFGNIPRRMALEANKTAKAMALALLEPLRQAGDIIEAFASEVSTTEGRSRRTVDRDDDETEARLVVERRSTSKTRRAGTRRPEEQRTEVHVAAEQGETGTTDTNLSGDIYSGLVKAVDRSLQVPSAVVDRLHQTYHRESERARRE